MAVILAGEDQHLVVVGGGARDAERLGVGGGGGEGELPRCHAKAFAQQPGDRDRILGRQQEVAAAGEALRDRACDRRRAEAAHHAEVALRHVEIAIAVDVGEIGAVAVRHENLGAGIERRHPGAGHAVRHQFAALGVERVGVRGLRLEARHFLGAQGLQLVMIEANGVGHRETFIKSEINSLPARLRGQRDHRGADDLRAPIVRRYPLFRVLETIGGVALLDEVAEAIRDSDDAGQRSDHRIVIDVPPRPDPSWSRRRCDRHGSRGGHVDIVDHGDGARPSGALDERPFADRHRLELRAHDRLPAPSRTSISTCSRTLARHCAWRATSAIPAELGEDAIARVVEALHDFRAVADGAGATRIVAVATSAVRDADDGQRLIEKGAPHRDPLQAIRWRHRSPMLGFLGAVHDLPVTNGYTMDVGGGSVEISSLQATAASIRPWTAPARLARGVLERLLPHVQTRRRTRTSRSSVKARDHSRSTTPTSSSFGAGAIS